MNEKKGIIAILLGLLGTGAVIGGSRLYKRYQKKKELQYMFDMGCEKLILLQCRSNHYTTSYREYEEILKKVKNDPEYKELRRMCTSSILNGLMNARGELYSEKLFRILEKYV